MHNANDGKIDKAVLRIDYLPEELSHCGKIIKKKTPATGKVTDLKRGALFHVPGRKSRRRSIVPELSRRKQKILKAKPVDVSFTFDQIRHMSVESKVILFLFLEDLYDYSILSLNAAGFDSHFSLRACFNFGICPETVVNGQKLLSVRIAERNIKFLDFSQYQPGSLASLAKSYGLPLTKGYFAHAFSRVANFDSVAQLPPLADFIGFNDTAEEIAAKTAWHAERLESGLAYNFQEELARYCDSDTNILCRIVCAFLEQALRFQLVCLRHFGKDGLLSAEEDGSGSTVKMRDILHPFSHRLITNSGFIYASWRKYVLPKIPNLFVLRDERGVTCINSSKIEMQVALYLEWKHGREADVKSAFTSNTLPCVGGIFPDIYVKFHDGRRPDLCIEFAE